MHSESSTGIYIAYPRTRRPRVGHAKPTTLVNSRHTKIGFTSKSFSATGRDYRETFDSRVKFIPVASIPESHRVEMEDRLIRAIASRHSRVGVSGNWFDTQDRAAILALIYSLLPVAANDEHTQDGAPNETTG